MVLARDEFKSEIAEKRLRWILSLFFLGLLALGWYTILRPFFQPLAWSAVVVLSTWPIYQRILRRLGNRAGMSAVIMTALVMLVAVALVGPLLVTLGAEVRIGGEKFRVWLASEDKHIPEIVQHIPILGAWAQPVVDLLESERKPLAALVYEYQQGIITAASLAARGVLRTMVLTLIFVFLVFFMYRDGAEIARQITHALRRIGGERFEHLLETSRHTVRGAVYGLLATAIVQGIIGGIGYAIAGAPVPVFFGFATMVFSLIPMGTPIVYLPLVAYVAIDVSLGRGLFLLLWCVGIVSTVDNLLRPIFISQATSMPLWLVFIGVVGGILGFGLLGIFVGPVLLAIGQALWIEWISRSALAQEQ